MGRTPVTGSVGSFALVLHTHLPWLAHHGSWPVGEEWLYQAWAGAYLPVFDVLDRLSQEGRTDLLTLGVTPVLRAQLDDPYCRNEFATWLGFWQVRAEELAGRREPGLREAAAREFRAAQRAMATLSGPWSAGLSPVLRDLQDRDAVEVLGGPLTHPFLPLLPDDVVRFALRTGLDDAAVRGGTRPSGIWAPECGYRPGLEETYAAEGISHVVLDGPTLLGAGADTADAWTLGSSDVVGFGRDLDVTYRVWSPRKGYPGGPWYRDFHCYDERSGFRTARVTSGATALWDKAPYDPRRAAIAVDRDAADFVTVVRQRLVEARDRRGGRPGLVVAAYDTELFGHWWHEGPLWLESVLRLLPEAGVRIVTLRGALEAGGVAGAVEPGPGSWGSGKDWRVWDGARVADIVDDNARLALRLRKVLDHHRAAAREAVADQLARTGMLALASDWAFMVTKDSAASYARARHDRHHADFDRLADALEAGDTARATLVAHQLRSIDGPFAHLDARLLAARP